MALPVQSLSHPVCFQATYFRQPIPSHNSKVTSEFASAKCRNGAVIRPGKCRNVGIIRPGSFGTVDTVFTAHGWNRWMSASSSIKNSHPSGEEEGSRGGKADELGNGSAIILPHNGTTSSSSSSTFVEDVLRERDDSLDSIEGLADVHQEFEKSLDSIEGLATTEEWKHEEDERRIEVERLRSKSLDSAAGLPTDGKDRKRPDKKTQEDSDNNNSEWRNVFPKYMQSKENDVEQDPEEEGSDGTTGDDPRRVSRPAGATKAAVEAVASVKEFDSQFGSQLLSSASPVLVSRRSENGNPAESGKLEDLISQDPIWAAIRAEARLEAEREPLLSSFLYASILAHSCFERSLGFVLANRLKNATLLATQLLDVFDEVFLSDLYIRQAIRLDVQAVKDRDPSCRSYIWALLYLKGYHALQAYRIAHALWCRGQTVLAFALQSRISEVFAVDIHPAARMGKAILLDHGTGVVIGETAVVGNRVSMLQGVTLGGTGKMCGDRHPKIKEGVLIGAGATILGNITVGRGAMVASGSLVLKDVPPHSMVAGTPARVVGYLEEAIPSLTMKQDATKSFCQDYQVQHQALLENRLEGGAGI